jgi:hypothetical protein
MVQNHVIKIVYTHKYYTLLHFNISKEEIFECVSFPIPSFTNTILHDRVDLFSSNAVGIYSGHVLSNLNWNSGIPAWSRTQQLATGDPSA